MADMVVQDGRLIDVFVLGARIKNVFNVFSVIQKQKCIPWANTVDSRYITGIFNAIMHTEQQLQ